MIILTANNALGAARRRHFPGSVDVICICIVPAVNIDPVFANGHKRHSGENGVMYIQRGEKLSCKNG